jgi:hypothetical protein
MMIHASAKIEAGRRWRAGHRQRLLQPATLRGMSSILRHGHRDEVRGRRTYCRAMPEFILATA